MIGFKVKVKIKKFFLPLNFLKGNKYISFIDYYSKIKDEKSMKNPYNKVH